MQVLDNVDGNLTDQGGVESGRSVESVETKAFKLRKWPCSKPLTLSICPLGSVN